MPYYRASIIDSKGNRITKELFAGCAPGAKQTILAQMGETRGKYGQAVGKTIGVVIQSIIEIDPPK